jgi:hypothetical protein
VHLLHEVHVEAHTYLKEEMPNEKGAIVAVNRLKSGCPRLRAKKRYEDPNERLKYGEIVRKRYEDPNERLKASERVKKRFEDPNERLKASEAGKNREKIKCEHCGNEFDPGNYYRWHGPNCKSNPNRIA